MAESQNDTVLNQWLAGHISDEDFMAEVGDESFQKYKQIIAEVDSWVPANEGHLPELEVIKSTPKVQKLAKEVSMWQNTRMLVAAAVTLLVIAFVVLWDFDDRVQVMAGKGDFEKILLPDGESVLYLSGGSSASWDEEDWTTESRTLELRGKGYFEVARGGDFIVSGEQASIQVLGTRFEFQEYYGNASIVCFEGTVRAMAPNDSAILVGGEALELEGDEWRAAEMPESSEPTWIQGLSTFKNSPLLKVIKTLEQEYDLSVNYENVNIKRQFTGSFPNNDLELALKIVFTPLQIRYTKQGNKLLLSE